jgi:outer membrane protein, multidrug efflux system
MNVRLTWQLCRAATVIACACALELCGCVVGPNYQRPTAPTPTAWKAEGPWRPGDPRDQIPKGEWWKIFSDPDLNALESQAMTANFSIQTAVANLQQARASAKLATSGLFPQASAGASAEPGREAANRPFTGEVNPPAITNNDLTLSFTASWEPDLFGRVRRTIESAQAAYQASGADLENIRLMTSSELAQDYFTLRELDAEIGVLDRTVESFTKALELFQERFKGGVASGLDVAQEQALLDATRAQAILLRQQRVQFEDAVATLVGQPASSFKLETRPMPTAIPIVPVGMPSDLLERRPDVAAAERNMASANAQIGVAKSAYYPTFALTGGGGLNSFNLARLISVDSTFWAVGAAVAESVLTGGARRAQVEFSQAAYDGTVSTYRGSVLTAVQEVEDNLAGLDVLDRASKAQADAVTDSSKALEIATNRYVGGLVSYLDVVTAQQTLLANQRLATQLQGQRLVTSVLLVKALGGGWDAASLNALHVKPTAGQALQP